MTSGLFSFVKAVSTDGMTRRSESFNICVSRGSIRAGSLVASAAASSTRTLQCGSGSSPERIAMKVSSSALAKAWSAAARTVGEGSDNRSRKKSCAVSTPVAATAMRASARSMGLNPVLRTMRSNGSDARLSPMRPSALIPSIVTPLVGFAASTSGSRTGTPTGSFSAPRPLAANARV